jgi:hypothetical protein
MSFSAVLINYSGDSNMEHFRSFVRGLYLICPGLLSEMSSTVQEIEQVRSLNFVLIFVTIVTIVTISLYLSYDVISPSYSVSRVCTKYTTCYLRLTRNQTLILVAVSPSYSRSKRVLLLSRSRHSRRSTGKKSWTCRNSFWTFATGCPFICKGLCP